MIKQYAAMERESKKQIEIEHRALLNEEEYRQLGPFLRAHGEDLGEDDKDVHFFLIPDKLLKVTNNISISLQRR